MSLVKKSRMNTSGKIILLVMVFTTITISCNTKSPSDVANTPKAVHPITKQFLPGNELITQDVAPLRIIDTSGLGPLSKISHCDTTIQLNDTVSYSIISANDEAGICSYFIVASFNSQKGKFIATKFLHADCDIDYSRVSYELNEHKIVSKDKIEVTTTVVIQKKDRTSANEEENIAEKHLQKKFFTISEDGGITPSETENL